MLYGRQRVRPGEAVITCKIAADKWSLDRRGQNPGLQPHWPGGAEKTNLWLVDGEVVIARKNVRSTANAAWDSITCRDLPRSMARRLPTTPRCTCAITRSWESWPLPLSLEATRTRYDCLLNPMGLESNGIGIYVLYNNTLG